MITYFHLYILDSNPNMIFFRDENILNPPVTLKL